MITNNVASGSSVSGDPMLWELRGERVKCSHLMPLHLKGLRVKEIVTDMLGVRQRVAGFMNQSPLDGNVTRRVKMAANVIDRFGSGTDSLLFCGLEFVTLWACLDP